MKKIIELLNIYNRPGGRYTYYPFHGKWNNQLSSSRLLDYLHNTDEKSVDLYIHIPFCHSLCTFCGCNVKIMKSNCDNSVYLQMLKNEWNLYPQKFTVGNIYIGGGTPNFLSVEELKLLINFFNKEVDALITIEIDPRFITQNDLIEYKAMGINRLSFGIQDFNSEVLKNINREQNSDEIINLLNFAASLNFDNINLDFIYGLNLQTHQSFNETLAKLKMININSVSLFPFAKVPWQNNIQKAFGETKDFSISEMNAFIAESYELLIEMGFNYIGMGYFSKEKTNFRRNIMGFIPKKNNIQIGLGVSAISSTPFGHTQNEKIYDRYMSSLKESKLNYFKSHLKTDEEHQRECFFEKLICSNNITIEEFKKFKTSKLDEVKDLFLADGILLESKDGFAINSKFKLFHKTILQYFDPNFIEQ
jgi:coproporphyrinogen III oxidase-like Fe-S oxidoreductase